MVDRSYLLCSVIVVEYSCVIASHSSLNRLVDHQLSKTGSYDFPVANNAHAVLTVLLARAIQARFTPARSTSFSNQASLAVLGSLGNRFQYEAVIHT